METGMALKDYMDPKAKGVKVQGYFTMAPRDTIGIFFFAKVTLGLMA